MKRIIEYKYGTRSYNIGDIVYLNVEGGKPTCMAKAVKNDNVDWRFKPLSEESYYIIRDGIIHFSGKPDIYAKQVEIKEEHP